MPGRHPRSMRQARATYLIARELGMITNVALRLQVEEGELVRRLLARAALEGHADDTEAVIRRRLSCTTRRPIPLLPGTPSETS